MRVLLLCLLLACCSVANGQVQQGAPYLLVLGTAQDGGYPHMGCTKQCCTRAWNDASLKRYVVSLALVDPATNQWWLLEATPDIKEQLHYFRQLTNGKFSYLPAGIFITHAHIGHYTGLMQLGREVMSTKDIPVYALRKMKAYLEHNGPWSQLVSLHNIALHQLDTATAVTVGSSTITAFLVPHRDEYSETAGFAINTPTRKYLFIPDINKWDKWNRGIVDVVRGVDVALVDGTFYDGNELPGRNMSEVPHPFISETEALFQAVGKDVTSKLYFIHLNHTNPLLWDVQQQKDTRSKGFNIAEQGQKL